MTGRAAVCVCCVFVCLQHDDDVVLRYYFTKDRQENEDRFSFNRFILFIRDVNEDPSGTKSSVILHVS